MRTPLQLMLFLLIAVFAATPSWAFDFPPWDTGHQSMEGDDGDTGTDPGDDGPCQSGSPVDLASGNFVHRVRDVLLIGSGPALDFVRTYNSRDLRQGQWGNGWTSSYDQRIAETTDGARVYAICGKPNGRREVFVRRADGGFDPPPHVKATLVKQSDGRYRLTDRHGVVTLFRPDGLLESITDRNSNRITFLYDSSGFLTRVRHASGREIQFVKGPNGRTDSLIDPLGRTFRYVYSASGDLVEHRDPLGATTRYQYDSRSNLTSITDPRGNVLMSLVYDTRGRVVTLNQLAETYTYSYLTGPVRTTRRDSSGRTWTYQYNATGNLTSVSDPLGRAESYAYDAAFNIIETTDRSGRRTRMTYDSAGNPVQITDARGGLRTITYNSFSQPLTIQERTGAITRFTYDAKGNLSQVIDPLSRTATYTYDSLGRLTQVTDPLSRTTSFQYDSDGNVVRTLDAAGTPTTAAYDALGRVVAITDAEGATTSFTYDAADRLVEVLAPTGQRSRYEYDASGNRTVAETPGAARTTYTYDNFNRLTRVSDPVGRATSFAYDRASNMVSRTNPRGQTISHAYDSIGRMISKSGAGISATFSYDANGNLLTAADSDSGLTFTYDELHRQLSASTSAGAQPATTISYSYDANGNRISMTDPSGVLTTYGYDSTGRLISLSNGGAAFGLSYDAAYRLTQVSKPGGFSSAYSYDALNRLSGLTHTSAGALNIAQTFDRRGAVTSLTDSAGLHTYAYDALNRVVAATHPAGQAAEAYSYDAIGNRLASHLGGAANFDAANQMLSDSRFLFTYDASGNIATKTDRSTGQVTTYAYDAEERLTDVTLPGGVLVRYAYDALGRRIAKTVASQTTQYVYDGQDIAAEYSGGSLTARYVHGPGVDQPLAVVRGGLTHYFEQGPNGSVWRVVSSQGVTTTTAYDSYGRTLASTGTPVAPYGFHGREYDPETGLYYMRARYYDPETGRFLTRDPLGFAGGLNLYQYAAGNPLAYRDPFGLRPCSDDWLDGLQTLLDLAGLIPGLGEPLDLLNAGIYGLRGDALNAGLSLGSAVPFLGWGTTAAKLGVKAERALVREGIYEFTSTSGRRYVGQSSDIDRRLAEHVRSGKVSAEEAARATRSEVSGGKTAREIAEQRRIDELGGIQNLENKVNPIGPNRRHLLDQ